ncbi:universal stress protein [Chitinophaga sp. GCM10012297]|uniref:Universal stress protein n=1 Tax=Chitinophaga chungangae TaxID=2821488 RepID=A0ABS3YGH6_9BACT|nr:universal stress protein [Chitinophaga chungangae]MBO9153779.1 universal stress protein [Chitinophaga chungangae]
MQKILVPVDFSDTAFNAARYAVSFARQAKATDIVLFHAYGLPVEATTSVVAMTDADTPEFRQMLDQQMAQLKQELQNELVEYINIETRTSPLVFIEAMHEALQDVKVSAVIMGITGKSAMSQRFIGSNALDAANMSTLPLVIVPHTVQYEKVHRILFAYSKKISLQPHQADSIRNFTSALQATLEVVHVSVTESDGEAPSALLQALGLPSAAYHEVQHTDLVAGIQDFAADNNADMLLAIPGEYGFFAELFHKSITKRLAFHSAVPVVIVR